MAVAVSTIYFQTPTIPSIHLPTPTHPTTHPHAPPPPPTPPASYSPPALPSSPSRSYRTHTHSHSAHSQHPHHPTPLTPPLPQPPLRLLLTAGTAFFALSWFLRAFGYALSGPYESVLLSGIVVMGAALFVLNRGCKFSLFKPAEEMVYIMLDEESRTKASAVIVIR